MPKLDVAIVVNGRDAVTDSMLAARPELLITLRTKAQMGFARATNVGLAFGLKRNYPYVFLLNPDTRVHPCAIERLLDAMDSCPELDVLGSEQCRYDDDSWSVPNEWWTIVLDDARRQALPRVVCHSFEIQHYTYVQAAAMMVRTAALRRVGLLDKVYGTFYEETDLCRRVAFVGGKVGILLGSKVQHFGGGHWTATTFRRFVRDLLMARNRGIFLLSDPVPPGDAIRRYGQDLRLAWRACRREPRAGLAKLAMLSGMLSLLTVVHTIARFRGRNTRLLTSPARVNGVN